MRPRSPERFAAAASRHNAARHPAEERMGISAEHAGRLAGHVQHVRTGHAVLLLLQGREATLEAVGTSLESSVDAAFRTAQRQAELREAKRQEAAAQAQERRMTFQQRVRLPLALLVR